MDAAVEEASCGVAASRGSADLVPLFESFRKQAPPGEIVSLPESRERGLPRLLMVDSTPLGHVSATGQLKKTFLEGWPTRLFPKGASRAVCRSFCLPGKVSEEGAGFLA